MKLGFIGCGNMATAIIKGIIAHGSVPASDIYTSNTSAERARQVAETLGVQAGCDNMAVVREADILFLSVKPQQYENVIAEIRNEVSVNQVVVTIAPGKTLAWLEDKFGASVKLVRCMPNTPALVGEGVTAFCPNAQVTDEECAQVEALLSSFGKAIRLKENLMDAETAVGGSAPAYVYAFIEALADAGVAEGLPRAQAQEIAAQTVLGSAKMVLETGKHPGQLKDEVCSPGGTTVAGLVALEQSGFRAATINAIQAAAAKSRQM